MGLIRACRGGTVSGSEIMICRESRTHAVEFERVHGLPDAVSRSRCGCEEEFHGKAERERDWRDIGG